MLKAREPNCYKKIKWLLKDIQRVLLITGTMN